MPRAKPFDKKTATTYALVHRPQNDPLIHDSDAPSQVFAEITSSSKQLKRSKIKQRGDLEEEFGLSGTIRDNEGEAAEHGIYFDDTSYDYMQHMRDIGRSTEATWVDAAAQSKNKGKAKQSLEDALRHVDLDGGLDDSQSLGGLSLASSSRAAKSSRQPTYQDQQDTPDALAGFQPDMDPRLREVLEALDDEEYVDDEDDIFAELAGDGGEEVDQADWEETYYDNDYDYDEDGWESDDTTKPYNDYRTDDSQPALPLADATQPPLDPSTSAPTASEEDGAWLASFAKSKGTSAQLPFASPPPQQPAARAPDLASSAALTSASQFPRRKKRKGALSSSTGFSMTSSALARTEPLSTLDSRFDRIAESYLEDEDDDDDDGFDDSASFATGMSRVSRASNVSKVSAWEGSQASEAPSLVPARFDSIMDEFLGGEGGKGRGRAMRKAGTQGQWGQQSGMDQLNEIRQGLGPARLPAGRKAGVQRA